jgi:hypothetical protein
MSKDWYRKRKNPEDYREEREHWNQVSRNTESRKAIQTREEQLAIGIESPNRGIFLGQSILRGWTHLNEDEKANDSLRKTAAQDLVIMTL